MKYYYFYKASHVCLSEDHHLPPNLIWSHLAYDYNNKIIKFKQDSFFSDQVRVLYSKSNAKTPYFKIEELNET